MHLETPQHNFKPLKDILYVAGFVGAVIAGSLLINALIFRTFNVVGPSMEPTLHTNERLIVNKVPRTYARAIGKEFVPQRGQIIVFRNPLFQEGTHDEFVVKRVIGLPGERVVVENGTLKIYNGSNPDGFEPDKDFKGPKYPTTGSVDTVVPQHDIFVSGDNRVENFSLDSRNGMGTIPLENIQGSVALRIYPFDKMKLF